MLVMDRHDIDWVSCAGLTTHQRTSLASEKAVPMVFRKAMPMVLRILLWAQALLKWK